MSLPFAISTHWNAGRHDDGEAMLEEILALGLEEVELGYNLHDFHLEGVRRMVAAGTIRVCSVHNYCPVPPGVAIGHPELYTLADPRPDVRAQALTHTTNTIRFAAELGASIVVSHCGNVEMRSYTSKLKKLINKKKRYTRRYEKVKLKARKVRDKRAAKQLDHLFRGLQQLLPILAESGVRLGLENLPSWEAFASEEELMGIFRRFGTDHLCYWHDTGHGQIRENLGLSNHVGTLGQLQAFLGGMHVHDVRPPLRDHTMPPHGHIDFSRLAPYGQLPILRVLEPSSSLAATHILKGLESLRAAWEPQPEPDKGA